MDSKVNECHRYSVDPVLDREIEETNNHSDGLVGELLKYGGSGMIHLLFEVVWSEELVPPKWREGLI